MEEPNSTARVAFGYLLRGNAPRAQKLLHTVATNRKLALNNRSIRFAKRIQRFWRAWKVRYGVLTNNCNAAPKRGCLTRQGRYVSCPITLQPILLQHVFVLYDETSAFAYDANVLANFWKSTLNFRCPMTQRNATAIEIRRLAKKLTSSQGSSLLKTYANRTTLRESYIQLQEVTSAMEGTVSRFIGKLVDIACDAELTEAVQLNQLRTTIAALRREIADLRAINAASCKHLLGVSLKQFENKNLRAYDIRNWFDRLIVPVLEQEVLSDSGFPMEQQELL